MITRQFKVRHIYTTTSRVSLTLISTLLATTFLALGKELGLLRVVKALKLATMCLNLQEQHQAYNRN